MMKRLLYSLLLIVGAIGILAAPVPAFAATDVLNPVCKTADQFNPPAVCKDNATNPTQDPLFGPTGVLTKAAQIVTIILGIVSVFVIMIAGLRIVASAGDSNTVGTMQKAIIAAACGLLVAGASQAMVTLVLSKL